MTRAIVRGGVLACAGLAVLAVSAPARADVGQPYCPGPPLGTFTGTTVDENGVHTDHFVTIGWPLGGIRTWSRSC